MEPVILVSVAITLLLFGSISRRAERSVLTPRYGSCSSGSA